MFKPSRGSRSGNSADADGKYSADGRGLFLIPEFGYTRRIDSATERGPPGCVRQRHEHQLQPARPRGVSGVTQAAR